MSETSVSDSLQLFAVPGVPMVREGDDLPGLLGDAIENAQLTIEDDDVLVVTSKLFSRAEGCVANRRDVVPGDRARWLARVVDKDEALVELILRESVAISRAAPGILITRHRLGFVSANSAIDASNTGYTDENIVLLMPKDPERSAAALRRRLCERFGVQIGIVVTDSHGRPFRAGTVGAAVAVAGVPALWDQRGRRDLGGRELQSTITAVADQIAAAADLVAGQADEGRPLVLVRGLRLPVCDGSINELLRDPERDLYA